MTRPLSLAVALVALAAGPACAQAPRTLSTAELSRQLAPNHVAFRVPNLEETVAWYRDVLGATVERRSRVPAIGPDVEIAFLRLGSGFHVEVVGGGDPFMPSPVPPTTITADYRVQGYKHVGFEVEDYDAVVAALRARDVDVFYETTREDYGVRIALFYDVNGYTLELYGPLPD